MDPIIGGALIAGGASIAGAGVSAGISGKMNRKTRRLYRQQANIQRRREDTAVQRRMADLEAAGVNPLMAVSGGISGAQTSGTPVPNQNPSGGIAAGNAIANIGGNIANTYATLQQGRKTQEETRFLTATFRERFRELQLGNNKTLQETLNLAREENRIISDTARIQALTALSQAQTKTEGHQATLVLQNIKKIDQELLNLAQQYNLTGEQIRLVQTQNLKTRGEWLRTYEQLKHDRINTEMLRRDAAFQRLEKIFSLVQSGTVSVSNLSHAITDWIRAISGVILKSR